MFGLRLDYKNSLHKEYIFGVGPDMGLGQCKAAYETAALSMEKGAFGVIMDQAGRECKVRGTELVSVEMYDTASEREWGHALAGELMALDQRLAPKQPAAQAQPPQQQPGRSPEAEYQPVIGNRFAA